MNLRELKKTLKCVRYVKDKVQTEDLAKRVYKQDFTSLEHIENLLVLRIGAEKNGKRIR